MTDLARLDAMAQAALCREKKVSASELYDASLARIDALNRRTSSMFDQAGRTIAAIDALAYRTTTVFDGASQAVARGRAEPPAPPAEPASPAPAPTDPSA